MRMKTGNTVVSEERSLKLGHMLFARGPRGRSKFVPGCARTAMGAINTPGRPTSH